MKKTWFRLDNAANIFPPISDKYNPNTFCLSATLSEPVNKQILEKSVKEVLQNEDIFRVRLKKGVFWYYLEDNNLNPIIREEDESFMEYISEKSDDNFLFKVYYYYDRISIVYFHALTDGTGGLYFLKQVVYRYLVNAGHKIKTENLVKNINIPTLNSDIDDTYQQINNMIHEKKIAEQRAFKLSGTPFLRFGTGLVFGECDIEDVKTLAKKYHTTITGYLCAVYLYSLYKSYIENKTIKKNKSKIIAVSIPVNIRKKHPSETKRNFSLVVRIAYNFTNGANFEDVIKSTAKQLKEKITTPQIDAQIKTNVSAEHNPFIKILPRALKNLVLKLAFNIRGIRQESTDFSNLGIVEVPASMKKYVKNIRFILHASDSLEKNLSLTGYEGRLYFAFSRRHIETDTEKYFFRVLSNSGVKCVVSSNNWEVEK